jgi:hypothetical protein
MNFEIIEFSSVIVGLTSINYYSDVGMFADYVFKVIGMPIYMKWHW